ARQVSRRELEDYVDAGRDRLRDHVEISGLHPAGRQLGGRVLFGRDHQQLPAGGHRHEDDSPGQENEEHHRLEGHFGRTRPEHVSRARQDCQTGGRRAQLLAVRLASHRRQVRDAYISVSRNQEHHGQGRARGVDVKNRRGPDLLLSSARALLRGRREFDRQRLLQGSLPSVADGVRRGSAEAAQRDLGGKRRITMLKITNLHVRGGNREILRGINLSIKTGEVHAIMGPNGSGKSTLARVLAGHPEYEVTEGSVVYEGEELLAMDPESRARQGVFMAFQYPVEIPGVNNAYFLKAALNALRKHRGLEELDAMEFMSLVRARMQMLDMDETLLTRPVNEGFSGGEKKRNEIYQMAVLEPKLAILDETDSGLDIDALKIVATGVNAM